MKLITVCNKRCPGLDLWETTAKLQNLTPVILGLEDQRPLGHESQHFGLKFILLAKYLSTLLPTELCLVTDGFDVIFHGCDGIEQRLEKAIHPNQILFAGDVYENPDQGLPYQTQHFRVPYLNSGVYAGRARTILAALQSALEKQERDTLALDDQRYFTEYMFSNPGSIVIDHTCEHFACTAGLEYKKDFYVIQSPLGKPRLKVFSHSPCVLHFQGFHKDTRILNELYEDNSTVKNLGKKLLRLPSKWGKAVGDSLVKLGSYFPVPKQYRVHTGAFLSFLLCFLLVAKTLELL
jgi:hypothetical protein